MRISGEVREVAVATLEGMLPNYPEAEQTTTLLEGILSAKDGPSRAATILKGLATEADVARLSQILPRVAAKIGGEITPVIDEVLALAARAPAHEAQALEAAMQVEDHLSSDQAARVLDLALNALVAGAERSLAIKAVLGSSATEHFRAAFGDRFNEIVLADLARREPDAASFDAANYLGSQFRELQEVQKTAFRKILVAWLAAGADYGEEIGQVARRAGFSGKHRIPIVRALLRAAENAGEAPWRAEALQQANLLAGQSKPARKLVNTAVSRMLESRDALNVAAVGMAGLAPSE